MQKLLLFCAMLLVASASAKPIRSKLDSLKTLLKTLPPAGRSFVKDTTRVRVWFELGDLTSDSIMLSQAIELAKEKNWEEGFAKASNYMGRKLMNDGYNYQSIEYLYNGLKVGEELKNEEIIAQSNRYLGACYYALEDDKLALEYYNRAIKYFKSQRSPNAVRAHGLLLSNAGLCLIRQKKYKQAIANYYEAIVLVKPLNDSLALSWFYSNLGSALRNNRDIEKSIKAFDISLSFISHLPNVEKAFTLSEKALSLLLLNKNPDALTLALLAKEYGKKTTVFENIYIYETVYRAYKANNNLSQALTAYEDWMTLKTEHEKDMKKKSVLGMKALYENEKKEEEINNQKFRNNTLVLGLIMLLLVGGIVYRNNILLSGKNKEIERQKDQIAQINGDLEDLNKSLEKKIEARTKELSDALLEIKEAMVKGQTLERKRVASELHDHLGGILSGIKYRMQAINTDNLEEKEKDIYSGVFRLINDAYSEVRHISHNLQPAELANYGFIGAIQKLIQDINFSQKLHIFTNLNGQTYVFDKKTELELYSVCLEIFTNIIKHAQATKVWFNIQSEGGKTLLSIKDDGIGMNTQNTAKGMGLQNIEQRLAGIKAYFSLTSDPSRGTTIDILI